MCDSIVSWTPGRAADYNIDYCGADIWTPAAQLRAGLAGVSRNSKGIKDTEEDIRKAIDESIKSPRNTPTAKESRTSERADGLRAPYRGFGQKHHARYTFLPAILGTR